MMLKVFSCIMMLKVLLCIASAFNQCPFPGLEEQQFQVPKDVRTDNQGQLHALFVVMRHGDRMPKNFPKASGQMLELMQKIGSGQLTTRGKSRAHKAGELISERYNAALLSRITSNQVFARSSSSKRCVDSAEQFLLAIQNSLAAGNQHDARAAQSSAVAPIEILIQEKKIDYVIGVAFCPELKAEKKRLIQEHITDKDMQDGDVALLADRIYSDLGIKIEEKAAHFCRFATAYELLLNLRQLHWDTQYHWWQSDENQKRLERLYLRCQKLRTASWWARRLKVGSMLGDIVENMRFISDDTNEANSNAKRMFYYSTHHSVLIGVLDALGAYTQPFYVNTGAMIAFELFSVASATGEQWFLRVVFNNNEDETMDTNWRSAMPSINLHEFIEKIQILVPRDHGAECR